jgi:hypothetical protein
MVYLHFLNYASICNYFNSTGKEQFTRKISIAILLCDLAHWPRKTQKLHESGKQKRNAKLHYEIGCLTDLKGMK